MKKWKSSRSENRSRTTLWRGSQRVRRQSDNLFLRFVKLSVRVPRRIGTMGPEACENNRFANTRGQRGYCFVNIFVTHRSLRQVFYAFSFFLVAGGLPRPLLFFAFQTSASIVLPIFFRTQPENKRERDLASKVFMQMLLRKQMVILTVIYILVSREKAHWHAALLAGTRIIYWLDFTQYK